MTMESIWKRRQQVHLKKFSRYSKYIFNDHVVIVLLFLAGALAFRYSEFVKTLTPDFIWGEVLVVLLFSLGIFVGKLATLVEAADQVFLLAKEKEWGGYFQKAKRYSLIFPAVVLFFLAAAAMPLLFAGREIRAIDFLPIYVTLLQLKSIQLELQMMALKCRERAVVQTNNAILWVISVFLFSISITFNPWVAPVLVTLYTVFLRKKVQVRFETRYPLYQWENMIAVEEQRTARVNRIINLFTDVPQVKSKAKRRKYLDGILRRLEGKGNTFQYLYARAFMRGSDYSGLFMRLLLIGVVLLAVTPAKSLALALSLLFLYVTGFQLLPLYFHYDENVMNRLYPVQNADKFKGFKRFTTYLLGSEATVFALAVTVGTDWLTGLMVLAANGAFVWGFTRFYMGNRTKKRDNIF